MTPASPALFALPLTADLLFESSPDCAKVLDLQGNLLSMNRNGQCLMEVDDPSLVYGAPWVRLWPGEAARQQIELALEQARQGQLGQFIAFCPTAKGVPKSWDVRVTPIHGADGQLQGFLSVSRDITALQELLQIRERAGILADAQKAAMEQAVSGAPLEQVLGTIVRAAEVYSEQALLVSVMLAKDGQMRNIAAPSLPQAYVEAIDGIAIGPNAGSCGSAAYFNQEVVVSDIATNALWQDYKELALSHGLRACWSQPLRSPGGAVLGTLACYHREVHVPTSAEKETVALLVNTTALILDHRRVIDERQTTQEALRQSEERYRLSIEASGNVGTWAIDLETNMAVMDAGFANLFGVDPEIAYKGAEVKYFSDRIHFEDRPVVLQAIADAIETGKRYDVDYRIVHPSAKVVWVTAKGKIFPDVKTGKKRFAGVAVDITSRKKIEHKLQDNDRRKDEFLAMLAHELRNPLAPIRAAAKLLQIAKLDEERLRQTSEIIDRQVRHMTGLVDDLLDVSRVTQGLIDLVKVPLDISHAVTAAIEQVRPMIISRSHRLVVEMAPEVLLVLGDEKRLIQLIANLLGNAAKFTKEGGLIQVKTEALESQVLIHVVDNGIGMPAELIESAFDLFTQGQRSSDRSSGGLGLGLALVKSLVELHGGTVVCDSPGAGKGSTFTLSLPRQSAETGISHVLKSTNIPQAVSGSLRIMVVDDNVDAASTLAMLLEAFGHEVLVEHRPLLAIEHAKTAVPKVFLLDIGLPEMNGYELAKRLRAQSENANAVLIAVTGYGQESDRLQTRAAGFDHHLVKPVDPEQLIALLAGIADSTVL